MLSYNTKIAIKSLRRHPLLAAVIIAGIALGIWASTTFTTVRHMFARDPLPGRSERLYFIRMDNWDPARPYESNGASGLKIPPQLTYRDSMELIRSSIPVRQTAAFISNVVVFPDRRVSRPFASPARLCFSDFFPMFEVPFHYGHGWDKRADANAEQVAVIDDATNQKLFGGANSVGKHIRLGDRDFTIVGVLAPWRPFIRMYDMFGNFTAEPEPIYIPFNLTPKMQLRSFGNTDGWKSAGSTYEDFLASEVDFIQFWVELRTPADVAAYHRFLDDYVRQQKKSGRFQRPLLNDVRSLRDMITEYGIVRPQLTAMAVMSVLFLVICSMNLTGLLLGKFLARAPEVSVRRALGARRIDIFMQHVIECELVGIAGGVIGMLLSIGTLRFIGKLIANSVHFSLDLEMIGAAVFLSLIAGLLAGVYPAWRVCTVQPAVQLKG